MARETKTYNCFLKAVTVPGSWTKIKAGSTDKENLGQTKTHLETPLTTLGYESAVEKNKLEAEMEWPTLAAGEVIVKATLWLFSKSGSTTTGPKFGMVGAIPGTVNTTAQEWRSTGIAASSIQTAARREAARFFIEALKTTAIKAFELYIEIETETETAVLVSGLQATGHTESSGTTFAVTAPTGAGIFPNVGDYLLLSVETDKGSGASSITDTAGNTWQKDGEITNASNLCTQVWSAKMTSAEALTVTANGLSAGSRVAMEMLEITPIAETSRVDSKGTATGTGTAVSVPTEGALRAQGDFAFFAGASAAEIISGGTFKNGEGWSLLASSSQTFLTPGNEYDPTPTPSATLTATGTFGNSGAWVGMVIAYKVLPSEGGGTEHPVTCGDTVTVSDSASATSSHARTAADTVAVSDSAERTAAKARSAADAVSVSDAAAQTTAHARTAADTITESDTATGAASKGRTTADTLSVSDQAVRASQALARTAADTVTVSESATRTSARARTAADSVSTLDSAKASLGSARSASETVTITDAAVRAAGATSRTTGDTVVMSSVAIATTPTPPVTLKAGPITLGEDRAGVTGIDLGPTTGEAR